MQRRRFDLKGVLRRFARPRCPETLPARLTRHRLYVLPTLFGSYLGAMVLAIFLGALNSQSNPALAFALMAGALLLIALIQTHQQLLGVVVLSAYAEPSYAGEPGMLRVALAHGRRTLLRGLAIEAAGSRILVDVPGGAGISVALELPGEKRGVRAVGRIRIGTRRPLNIAHAWGWVWPVEERIVYPRLENGAPPIPGGGSEEAWGPARVGTHLHHLRDYRYGDALRDIAWRASARQGKLMAREHEAPQGGMRTLAWDGVAHLPAEEALSRLATWIVHADCAGLRTCLTLPSGVIGPGLGSAHRHACLTALARMPADD